MRLYRTLLGWTWLLQPPATKPSFPGNYLFFTVSFFLSFPLPWIFPEPRNQGHFWSVGQHPVRLPAAPPEVGVIKSAFQKSNQISNQIKGYKIISNQIMLVFGQIVVSNHQIKQFEHPYGCSNWLFSIQIKSQIKSRGQKRCQIKS